MKRLLFVCVLALVFLSVAAVAPASADHCLITDLWCRLINPPSPDYTVYCEGDGTSGYRATAVYVYPAGTTNDVSIRHPAIRQAMAHIDTSWYAASGNRQRPRFACDPATEYPEIQVVQGPAIGADGEITFSEIRSSMAARGFTATNRIYLLFVDNIAAVYPFSGQGTIDNDDRAGQENLNNTGPAYTMVDADGVGWGNPTLGRNQWHEYGHTLGAVQCSAPHSSCPAGESGHHHCYDEADVMCYADGGSYFDPDGDGNSDRQRQSVCETEQWDCGKNDYYNYAPAAGSYLATHWNTARNRFLTP